MKKKKFTKLILKIHVFIFRVQSVCSLCTYLLDFLPTRFHTYWFFLPTKFHTYLFSCLLDFLPTCFCTYYISYLPHSPPRGALLSLSAARCEEVVVVVVVGVLPRFVCLLSASSAAVSYNS